MEKNYTKELVKLKLENIGADGDTTAYYNEEQINIFGGIPGETVIAEIDIQKKNKKKKNKNIWNSKKYINNFSL